MLLTTSKDNLSYYLGLIRPSPTQTNVKEVSGTVYINNRTCYKGVYVKSKLYILN